LSSHTDSARRPSRPRAGLWLIALALILAGTPAAAHARSIKLWPLFEYEHDEAAGTRSVKALGPLIEYRSDPDYYRLMLRPVLSIRQARGVHDDEVRVLYPLLTSRWAPIEQSTTALGGLLKYTTNTTEDGRALTLQRFRAFPFYFYDWDVPRGGRVSLVPFYADLEDFAGFERVEMLGFPLYLRLRQPLVDRQYLPFPFIGRVGGELGSGHRVWPLYGRKTLGETDDSGFVLWPFYVWETRTSQGESERRFMSFPFYSRVSGPRRESTAFGTIFYVHTLDRTAEQESWGFPWPLWVYQKSTTTDERLTFRLFPFYQARRQGQLEARFVAWPLYRERHFSDDQHTYERRDALLVLARDERWADLESGTSGSLRTVFPFYRNEVDGDWEDGNVLALLDAVLPRNDAVRMLYAPLWAAYAWNGPVEDPRWSAGWGAVTHGPRGTVYPWHWGRDQP
jgi:hypothetical protein